MYKIQSKQLNATDALKVLWLAVVFCIFLPGAKAQTWKYKAPDSLMNVVKNSTGEKKVDALNLLAKQTILSSTSEAVPFVKQARQLAIKLKYHKGEANAIENNALLVFRHGNFLEAINLMSNAALIYQQYNFHDALINCLILKAGYCEFVNDNGEITDTYLQALNASKAFKRLDLESNVESAFGLYLMKSGNYSDAEKYIISAVVNSKKSNNNSAIGNAFCSLALYRGMGKQYETCIHYFRLSLTAMISANETQGIFTVYSNMGDFYSRRNEYDSAFVYYNKALKLAAMLNDAGIMATTFSRMAHVFQMKQLPDSALKYQFMALDLRRNQGNRTLIGSSLSNIGTVFAQKRNFPLALNYYNQGLAMAKETGYLKYIQYNYQRLCELFVMQKKYKEALVYNMLLKGINDSILQNETRQKFSKIQTRFESEQKQKAIEFLTKEHDIQNLRLKQTRFLAYILVMLLVILVIIGLLLDKQVRLKMRHTQMDSEQKLLRSQMNPHFIFNALVSIQGFIYHNESEVAAKYLTRFARLIRLVLSNSREEFITLQREIDMLENYLALQKMRFNDKFDYTFNVDPDLDTEFLSIPPMLAQPFLENAIEHGLLGMDKPGYIEVSILEKNHNILIQVEDNGNMRKINLTKHSNTDKADKSDALLITRERIQQLNQKHALKIILSIKEVKDDHELFTGTIAMIMIPEKRTMPGIPHR